MKRIILLQVQNYIYIVPCSILDCRSVLIKGLKKIAKEFAFKGITITKFSEKIDLM
jgi:hypothetical protein